MQWGGNVGGPIIKNKLHFFANLERIDQNRGITINIPARPDLNFTDFTHDNVWNWMVRMDHQINADNTWAVRWLRETSPQSNQFPGVTNWTQVARREGNRHRLDRRRHAELGDQEHQGQHAEALVHERGRVLRQPRLLRHRRPGVARAAPQPSRRTRTASATRANRRMDPAYQLDETFAWFVPGKKGDHDLKFGDELRLHAAPHLRRQHPERHVHLLVDRPGLQRRRTRAPTRIGSRFACRARPTSSSRGRSSACSRRTSGRSTTASRRASACATTSRSCRSRKRTTRSSRASTRIRSTRTTSRRASASPSALDDAGTSVVRGGWGLFYQKTPFTFVTGVVSAGVFSDSFIGQLCGPATAPICPSTTQVDPGPSAGRLPTNPFLVNGPVVNRALLNALFPAGHAGEEHRHRAVRQSGPPSAVLAPGERRIRAAAFGARWR